MSRTVWNAPSATKKEVSFKPETELGYVTSNCMGHAVRQFEKEACLRLGTGVEYVAWNCMGSAVCQFEKEVSFRPATAEVLSNWHFKKKLVIAARFKKWPQPSLLSLAPKIKASCPLKINLGFGLKPVQN